MENLLDACVHLYLPELYSSPQISSPSLESESRVMILESDSESQVNQFASVLKNKFRASVQYYFR